MATILYDKDGNAHRIQAKRVQSAIQNGYSPVKPGQDQSKPSVKPQEQTVDDLEAELHDQEEDVAEAEQAIRDRAKELGISHYWTKKVENLLDEIEALEAGDSKDASED